MFYLTLESAQQRGKRRNKVSQIVLDIVKEHSQIEFSWNIFFFVARASEEKPDINQSKIIWLYDT